MKSDMEPMTEPDSGALYAPWQTQEHAVHFDSMFDWPDRAVRRYYESFNDIQLLCDHKTGLQNTRLVEIGCATGDLYRYITRYHNELAYVGIDISTPAVERARAKYPDGRFFVVNESLDGIETHCPDAGILYCKDVVLHQTDPFGFLRRLLEIPNQAAVIRLRTRDRGNTVLDSDLSCQSHYGGWVPYMILNLDEMVETILDARPITRLEIVRHYIVLGGWNGRYVPKDCYDPATGTAETAVYIRFAGAAEPDRPPEITIGARKESSPAYTFLMRARRQIRRRVLGARNLSGNQTGGHPI